MEKLHIAHQRFKLIQDQVFKDGFVLNLRVFRTNQSRLKFLAKILTLLKLKVKTFDCMGKLVMHIIVSLFWTLWEHRWLTLLVWWGWDREMKTAKKMEISMCIRWCLLLTSMLLNSRTFLSAERDSTALSMAWKQVRAINLSSMTNKASPICQRTSHMFLKLILIWRGSIVLSKTGWIQTSVRMKYLLKFKKSGKKCKSWSRGLSITPRLKKRRKNVIRLKLLMKTVLTVTKL